MCLAIPGKIVDFVQDQPHLGLVEVGGVRRKVDLGLLEENPPRAGEWVLIHVGFAMTKISEEEAREQMHLLSMLGEAEQAMTEVRGYGVGGDADAVSLEPIQPGPPGGAPDRIIPHRLQSPMAH